MFSGTRFDMDKAMWIVTRLVTVNTRDAQQELPDVATTARSRRDNGLIEE
jgi:hypothetical protein